MVIRLISPKFISSWLWSLAITTCFSFSLLW